MKPILLLTQTYLDESKLINYLQSHHQGKWIIPDYSSKSDFKEDLSNLQIEYPIKTNLLLGDLDTLSLSFQQSILKFLEEPPSNLQIFITKKSEYMLLPTIKSRVEIISLTNQEVVSMLNLEYIEGLKKSFTPVNDATNKLLKSSMTLEDFGDIANIEREDIIFYLWQIGYYLTTAYTTDPNPIIGKRITDVLLSKQNLMQSMQKKIALQPLLF
jgi:DNA polymerase III, delta subunit